MDDRLLAAVHRMRREGGGFAGAIADAALRADSSNLAKLLAAFPDLFARFATPATEEDIIAFLDAADFTQWPLPATHAEAVAQQQTFAAGAHAEGISVREENAWSPTLDDR